jgi:hypothetical protein
MPNTNAVRRECDERAAALEAPPWRGIGDTSVRFCHAATRLAAHGFCLIRSRMRGNEINM